jgi:plasmid stabilization system protein ParE
MRHRLSKLALADLEEIHDFTLNRWGEEQANRYLGMLWDALGCFGRDPNGPNPLAFAS